MKSKTNIFKTNAAMTAKKTAFVPFIYISYIILIAFFVDKPNMAVIVEKQHVARRRKTSNFRHSNKSAGFNTGFMSQFSQKPAYSNCKNTASLFVPLTRKESPLRSILRNARESSGEKPRGSGFSFPVPSLATLAVIAGTIVIALAALNWENFNFKTPDVYAFKPSEDSEAERHTMRYAAIGIPGIMLTETAPIIDDEKNQVSEENSVSNIDADNPHGSLVAFNWQQYRVQRGDSVSAIAQRFGVSVGAIIASNEISNARRLQEGAVLKIPNIDGIPYQIQSGDSLSRISASFNVPLDVILDVNDIKSDNIRAGETIFIPGARMNDIDLRLSLGELFIYPSHNKYITSGYGMRKDPISGVLSFHGGIDFRGNTGETVMAALDGVVSVVSENWLYGKHIILSHSNGYKTLYGHLSSFSVRQGDRVARGRKIGEVGNTGYSTGPHLHFGIYDRNNRLINPLELLK
jgi:murein DD-endopeptidase MepM/ murein hydrolase activator NlpD